MQSRPWSRTWIRTYTGVFVFHGVLELGRSLQYPHTTAHHAAAISQEEYRNRLLTGPAKRNLTMRCIIQAFPLSKAPAYWLLDHESEPITSLSHALQSGCTDIH